jgi:hypothetical protein
MEKDRKLERRDECHIIAVAGQALILSRRPGSGAVAPIVQNQAKTQVVVDRSDWTLVKNQGPIHHVCIKIDRVDQIWPKCVAEL